MVAYSFKKSFVDPIKLGHKKQTIRLPRKRHARIGEPLQLYTAMRTVHCRKIIDDPLCVGVDEIRIDLREADRRDATTFAEALTVNGIPVVGEEAIAYARGDGFINFKYMMRWWLQVHGQALFEGVAIRWEPRP